MKRTVIISAVLTCAVLAVINYFTGFGYYLPHRTIVIDEGKSNDIFIRSIPMYLAISNETINGTIINPDYK